MSAALPLNLETMSVIADGDPETFDCCKCGKTFPEELMAPPTECDRDDVCKDCNDVAVIADAICDGCGHSRERCYCRAIDERNALDAEGIRW